MRILCVCISLLFYVVASHQDTQVLLQTESGEVNRQARGIAEGPSLHAPAHATQGNTHDAFDDVALPDDLEELDVRALASLIGTKSTSIITGACDQDVKTHFLRESDCEMFVNQSVCQKAKTEIVWLDSYPCSGNTWTRVILEAVTQVYTGSVFNDPNLKKAGMKGEGNNNPGEVLVVKTHAPLVKETGPRVGSKFHRAIVIIREPLKAALSWHTFKQSGKKHVAEISEEALKKSFKEKRDELLEKWKEFATSLGLGRDAPREDTLLVKYEDILANIRGVYLKQILPFLGLDASNPGVVRRLYCAIEAAKGNKDTHRSHSYRYQFDEEDRQAVHKIIGGMAHKLGYT